MKAHLSRMMRWELTNAAMWWICAAGLVAAIAPRIQPLLADFLYYDDFGVTPASHLRLFRFVPAAEQSLWIWVYGDDYMRSVIPKLISIFYIMSGTWAMLKIFRSWGVSLIISLISSLLFLVNPIVNDYITWNTLSPASLSWAVTFIGYYLQYKDGRVSLICGIVLSFLALGTYQIVLGLPVMLVVGELSLRISDGNEKQFPWKRRILWIGLPIFLYMISITAIHYILGVSLSSGEAQRGFPSLSDILSQQFFAQRYQQSSHSYFNVFQPLVSYYLGMALSWSIPWKIWAFIAIVTPISLILSGMPKRRSMIISIFLFLVILTPMAFQWIVNHSSSGLRVAVGMSLAFSFWLALLSTILLGHARLTTAVGFGQLAALVLVVLLLPVAAKDSAIRTEGFRATEDLTKFLRESAPASPTAPTVTAIEIPPDGAARTAGRGAIVVSYNLVMCRSYSLFGYRDILAKFLNSNRMALIPASELQNALRDRLTTLCYEHRAEEICSIFGVRDAATGQSAICFVGE